VAEIVERAIGAQMGGWSLGGEVCGPERIQFYECVNQANIIGVTGERVTNSESQAQAQTCAIRICCVPGTTVQTLETKVPTVIEYK
jgi:hypothetical protein